MSEPTILPSMGEVQRAAIARFLDQMGQINATLTQIADQLKALDKARDDSMLAEAELSAAYVMREACALEVDRLYGVEAAAQVRDLPLSQVLAKETPDDQTERIAALEMAIREMLRHAASPDDEERRRVFSQAGLLVPVEF